MQIYNLQCIYLFISMFDKKSSKGVKHIKYLRDLVAFEYIVSSDGLELIMFGTT